MIEPPLEAFIHIVGADDLAIARKYCGDVRIPRVKTK